jgi:hypothetical protein
MPTQQFFQLYHGENKLIASLDFQNIKNNIHSILTLFRSANDMGRKWIASLDSQNKLKKNIHDTVLIRE